MSHHTLGVATHVEPHHFDFLDDQSLKPEHHLLIAVLYDALVILSKPHLTGEENILRYQETREWLFSEAAFPFSYLWVCMHLYIDPERLRREFLRELKNPKEKRRRHAARAGIS